MNVFLILALKCAEMIFCHEIVLQFLSRSWTTIIPNFCQIFKIINSVCLSHLPIAPLRHCVALLTVRTGIGTTAMSQKKTAAASRFATQDVREEMMKNVRQQPAPKSKPVKSVELQMSRPKVVAKSAQPQAQGRRRSDTARQQTQSSRKSSRSLPDASTHGSTRMTLPAGERMTDSICTPMDRTNLPKIRAAPPQGGRRASQ